MTPKRKKLLLWTASCLLGGFVVLLGVSFLIMQTQWFADFLRAKTISLLEDSTGGRVEIQSVPGQGTTVRLRFGESQRMQSLAGVKAVRRGEQAG